MLDVLIENIKDFFRGKRLLAVLISIGVFLFFTASVIIIIQSCPAKNKFPKGEQFVSDQELLVPSEPVLEKEYYFSRNNSETWDDQEVKEWFTVPDGRSFEQLQKANDGIAADITGAAP
jgi:hypothetical protein